jgi:rare lipoprotein A
MPEDREMRWALGAGLWSDSKTFLASAQRPASSALLLLVLLSACATQRHEAPRAPADVLSIPEPTPKEEARSQLGNPPFYDVFGKRYFVLATAAGYVDRGVASWYGPGFHKERTATGDPYDMYAMTAAHKTLPLPCYARVTNLSNGRSVIVHINDRGPFKDDRIIDLSYTAATKLDMIRAGTALVEVQVVNTDGGSAPSPRPAAPLFVQAGAFTEAANAERLVARLKQLGYPAAFVRTENRPSRDIHRVRIGPIASVEEFDRIVAHLRSLGIDDARLAAAD